MPAKNPSSTQDPASRIDAKSHPINQKLTSEDKIGLLRR